MSLSVWIYKRIIAKIECCDLEIMHLETLVHSSSFCPGLSLGLETWWSRSRDIKRSWQQHCKNNASNALGVPSTVQWGTSSACDESSRFVCPVDLIAEICRKNLTTAHRLWTHSRSLEPTRIDRQPIPYMGPISHRFRDKRRFRSKIAYFQLYAAAIWEFLLEFCSYRVGQKVSPKQFKFMMLITRHM